MEQEEINEMSFNELPINMKLSLLWKHNEALIKENKALEQRNKFLEGENFSLEDEIIMYEKEGAIPFDRRKEIITLQTLLNECREEKETKYTLDFIKEKGLSREYRKHREQSRNEDNSSGL